MKTQRILFLSATVAPLVVCVLAVAADKPNTSRVVSVLPEAAAEGLTPAESRNLQENLSLWLLSERPARVTDVPVRVSITAGDMASIEEPEPVNAAPLKVGLVVPLESPLRVAGLVNPKTGRTDRSVDLAGGSISKTRDGGYVWAVQIGSEGAGGIRVHVEDLFLPNNAELYFYSDSGESYGPYTGLGPDGTGEFWTPSIVSDIGTLQVRFNAPVTVNDLTALTLKVAEIGHISRSFFGIADEGSVSAFCQFNASCIVNNNCQSNSAVNDAKLAVAKMLWVKGCCIYTCSGGLIADSDPGTQIPYFMTANHCLSTSSTNLEAFFQYQVPCGTSTCTATYTDPPNNLIAGKTVGATIKATGAISSGDFSLFQLSQNPPAGSVFLGWTNAVISNQNGAALHRISHPSGAPQAYSNANVNTSAPTCQGWNRGPLIYSTGNVGAIEGGSSGSPVVNASGQFVGQLTGSCGSNLNNVCAHSQNATVDGAFAHYYNSVSSFLAGSGGGGCLPAGSSCSSNSQCCSNRCRGGTCRN